MSDDAFHLGKYQLFSPLRGGTLLNVPRAVKILHPQLVVNGKFIERFRSEAQLAARLEHPHIVPVYDLGEHEGRFYLAMRYMPGCFAFRACARRSDRLPPEAYSITSTSASGSSEKSYTRTMCG